MKIGFISLPDKSGHQSRGIGGYTRNLIESLRVFVTFQRLKLKSLTIFKVLMELIYYT
jgi:hypothetical protein